MNRKKIILIICLLGVGIGLFFVFRFYQIFFWSNTTFENEYSYIFIDSDDTIDSLKIELNSFLKSTVDFDIAAEKKGYTKRILPGKYRIMKGMGNNQIINTLRSERLATRVVFNNQERLEDLVGRLSIQIEADSLELLTAFQDSIFLADKGFNKKNALTMYIPNSYDVFWDITPADFRKRMLDYHDLFWNEKRIAKARALKLNQKEVYILASIIQKESVQLKEQNRIAGVYLNRLKIGMKLQADPTVIFALKNETNDFRRIIKRVLYKDLGFKSLFNTYLYSGLPPGPITMPDISAIDAVLNSEEHDYLYFVASPLKPGYHLFAKNLKEHNKNKRVYTRWLRKQKIYR